MSGPRIHARSADRFDLFLWQLGGGKVSPMQGGLASLSIVKHNLAQALVGEDPLDHAVLHDRPCCTVS